MTACCAPPSRPMSDAQNAKRLQLRLEELRRDLDQQSLLRRAYALDALLSLLWVEEGRQRVAVATALCGYSPLADKSSTPHCAVRLCARLGTEEAGDALAPPPGREKLVAWASAAVAETLLESVNALKVLVRIRSESPMRLIEEATCCRDALTLAQRLRCEATAEVCVRLLRLFPPDIGLTVPTQTQEAMRLRDAAGRVLGSLSPDALFPLWVGLGSPDGNARRDLLPVLDYLTDARAIRHLIHLLERRAQWTDGELVGWFVVRAFERINDRRALPPLRRLAEAGGKADRRILPWRPHAAGSQPQTSPELALEARRVMEAIEYGRIRQESSFLLRPSQARDDHLLLPAEDVPEQDFHYDELLRPDEMQEKREET